MPWYIVNTWLTRLGVSQGPALCWWRDRSHERCPPESVLLVWVYELEHL